MKKANKIGETSSLFKLEPFLDDEDVLKVDGR